MAYLSRVVAGTALVVFGAMTALLADIYFTASRPFDVELEAERVREVVRALGGYVDDEEGL